MWHHAAAYAEHYHHPYASHAVAGHGGWLMHTIIGGIIHGLIYAAIFRLFRGISLEEAMIVAVVGVALVVGGYWLWNRSREA
ncbi:hypothetical protein A4U49_15385 [Acidithiobacillus ferrivorans]|uniref:hypothetical protein n=1 Tax=Acidithiobacillus ferrivorans TaxID=160808 RepID=UPI0008937FA8|nr:hypothetical protein [Acidithiobacillus ferrivorans]OFA14961.1 hypothetical protein A4U49_15385 [Acidithiobacillus ferrivorans]